MPISCFEPPKSLIPDNNGGTTECSLQLLCPWLSPGCPLNTRATNSVAVFEFLGAWGIQCGFFPARFFARAGFCFASSFNRSSLETLNILRMA